MITKFLTGLCVRAGPVEDADQVMYRKAQTLYKIRYSRFFFFCFLGPHTKKHGGVWHMEVPKLGVESELQLLVYTTAHGNTRSLTRWARPGIEPASSWILVGFINHWATKGTPGIVMIIQMLVSSFIKLPKSICFWKEPCKAMLKFKKWTFRHWYQHRREIWGTEVSSWCL